MKNLFALLLLLFTNQIIVAQKKVTLSECETQFLKNNLFLIASHFNIDAAKAQTLQAKIWDNPAFTADINAYNPENKQYFDIGKDGQKAFAIEQLITMGGKKRNEVHLAQVNEKLAELEFEDVIRTLKFQLRKSFYTVYYNSKNIETTQKQISNLQELINSYSIQTQKGNVPLKDLVRLQSLYLNLKNEAMDAINSNYEEEGNLKLLMNETSIIIPQTTEADFIKYTKEIPFDIKTLEQEAVANRPDLLLKQKNIEANEINIKLQKSLSIPDLTAGLAYDQRSGAFNNQTDLTLKIPLPFWDKNKGNIQVAKTTLEQSKVEKQNADLQLNTDIITKWNKWQEAKNSYNLLKPSSTNDLESVYNGILQNFQKRNISMLEFSDFMESYHQSNIQLNELKKTITLSGEELNNTINKDLF